jgi:hypothetical protein
LGGATTGKTMTITSSHTNDRTLTLPDATDTLIGKDTTDTLTNKRLTAPKVNEDVAVTATATEINQLDASAVGAQTKFAKAALTIVAATTAQATAISIPAGSIIKRVFVDVQTQEATGTTKTVDIGINGGNEDGFLDGVSVAAAGTIIGSLAFGAVTLGELSYENSGDSSAPVPKDYVCAEETTICYSLGSANFAELVANVIVEYIDIA